MSTALAPVENGHECLDLSSYDPQAYNILSPVLRLDTAAPYLRFRAVEVRLDPDITRGDCYAAPGTKWTRERGLSVPMLVAPSTPGLLMIASGARYMHAYQIHNTWGNMLEQVGKDGPVLRSVSFVAAGEGVDDLKIHRLLQDAMKQAAASGNPEKIRLRDEAEAYLKRILAVWNGDLVFEPGTPYLGLAHTWGYEQFYQDWQEQMARFAARLKGVKWE